MDLLRRRRRARAAIAAAAPDVVYHLAALAHVGRSWADPAATLAHNQAIDLDVLEAVRAEAPGARARRGLLGEVYGPPASLPVDETRSAAAAEPVRGRKAAGDLLAGFYADAHGLRVVRPRAFNHAARASRRSTRSPRSRARSRPGSRRATTRSGVVTGNPDARRDFTDVRDVVRAYRLLAEAGEPGVFNVCSGRLASPRELVAVLAEVAGVEIEHEVDPRSCARTR